MKKIFYKVLCPRDNNKIYTMEARIATLPNNKLLPSPPDGCDNCNGHELCSICVENLFKIFLKDPLLKLHPQPINPLKDL